jgi:hypothetical protein
LWVGSVLIVARFKKRVLRVPVIWSNHPCCWFRRCIVYEKGVCSIGRRYSRCPNFWPLLAQVRCRCFASMLTRASTRARVTPSRRVISVGSLSVRLRCRLRFPVVQLPAVRGLRLRSPFVIRFNIIDR